MQSCALRSASNEGTEVEVRITGPSFTVSESRHWEGNLGHILLRISVGGVGIWDEDFAEKVLSIG